MIRSAALFSRFQVRVLRARVRGGELPGDLHRQPPVRPHLLRRRRAEGPRELHESAAEGRGRPGHAHRGPGKWGPGGPGGAGALNNAP